jgi:hypothetical protein
MSLGSEVAALTAPEQLYDLLDPDVMWYSADVNSNDTCNGKDDAVACIERSLARGLRGRFELLGEAEDLAVVHPVLDPPEPPRPMCLLLRSRDGLIVEMRDFPDAASALHYAGIV